MLASFLLFILNHFSGFFSLYLFNGLLVIDFAGIYLMSICLIFFYFFFNYLNIQGLISYFFLLLSIISASICFIANNFIIFWLSYELAILFLLLLIYKDSIYSERFLGGWYLWGYMILTGLPMLLCLMYLAFYNNSFNLVSDSYIPSFFLFLLFITKIPLPPFHGWLPVVHAEASTPVSIMLSGYIMKLGFIGVYRFCGFCFLESINYSMILFLFSLFFFLISFFELDSKRWLAYLSLSHIVIPVIILYTFDWFNVSIGFFYCLGHGFSAGILFYLFSFLSEGSGTRNWASLINYSGCGSLLILLIFLSLLSVASFPPSINFFSEIVCIKGVLSSWYFLICLFIYVFLAGLIPIWIFGSSIVNFTYKGLGVSITVSSIVIIILLFFWWWLGFLLI